MNQLNPYPKNLIHDIFGSEILADLLEPAIIDILPDILSHLTKKEQRAVQLYYEQQLTLGAVGGRMGTNKANASTMIRSILVKLGTILSDNYNLFGLDLNIENYRWETNGYNILMPGELPYTSIFYTVPTEIKYTYLPTYHTVTLSRCKNYGASLNNEWRLSSKAALTTTTLALFLDKLRQLETNPTLTAYNKERYEIKLIDSNSDISLLNLSCRSYHILKRNGVSTIQQLLDMKPEDIRTLPGVGTHSYANIMDAIEKADIMSN